MSCLAFRRSNARVVLDVWYFALCKLKPSMGSQVPAFR